MPRLTAPPAMTSRSLAGSAKVALTPPLGTPMGGNARLDNYAQGVLQDLYARALWMGSGESAVCLISLDLLGLWQADADTMRRAVSERTGLHVDSIMVACTHTHSGPDTMQSLCWSDEKLARDSALLATFWATLPGKVADAAERAQAAARPARAFLASAENTEIANNRRLRMKGGDTRMNWELPPPHDVERPLGPIDPRVTVLHFADEQGGVIGGFVHYACHPAILAGANNLFSGDFPGFACAELEAALSCGAFLFLNGAEGNINHIDYEHPERGRGTDEVQRCAASLVASVRTALSSSQPLSLAPLGAAACELQLPLRPVPAEAIQTARDLLSSYDGRDLSMPDAVPPELNARRTLRLAEARETGNYPGRFATLRGGKVAVPLQAFTLGDLVLGAAPAEMFVEFGLQFRAACPARTALVIGLANGLVGYVPTPDAFVEGGYEPALGPSYLEPSAGSRITEALIALAAAPHSFGTTTKDVSDG